MAHAKGIVEAARSLAAPAEAEERQHTPNIAAGRKALHFQADSGQTKIAE